MDEYRREMIQRVLSEARNLDKFRRLWVPQCGGHDLCSPLQARFATVQITASHIESRSATLMWPATVSE